MSNPRNLSSFTLIVTFVCLSLIGVVLVPLLPVKLAPSRTLPGLTVSFSMPGNSSRVIEAESHGGKGDEAALQQNIPHKGARQNTLPGISGRFL